MKTNRIFYYITTSIVALMMLFSFYAYLTKPAVEQGFRHLGFPSYFRVELALAKLIGAVVLLVPVRAVVKEWAYAGFAITFVSAFIAHISSGDGMSYAAMPLIFLALLLLSYFTYRRGALPEKMALPKKHRAVAHG